MQKLDLTLKGHNLLFARALAREERCVKPEWVAMMNTNGAFSFLKRRHFCGVIAKKKRPKWRGWRQVTLRVLWETCLWKLVGSGNFREDPGKKWSGSAKMRPNQPNRV